MWNALPIRHKLSVVIGGALLISVLISTVISNTAMRTVMMDRIEADEIPATLNSIANAIEKEINIPLTISRAMAQNHFTNQWLSQGEDQAALPEISKYLQVMQSQNNAITSFIVSGNSLNYYTPEGVARTIDKNADSWFFNFINSNKEYSLDIDNDSKLKKLALFINFRTLDKKSIAGIGMDIQQVGDLIRAYKVGEQGLVYVVNQLGEIQIHPNESITTGTELNDYLKDPISQQLLNTKQHTVMNSNGYRQNILAAKYLPALNWFVVVEVPTSEILSPINNTSMQLIILNIIVAVILIFAGLWVALGVAKPVVQASKMLDSIASGDADLSKKMPITTGDEVGTLAKAFNHFVGQLSKLIQAVAQSSLQVQNSVSELSNAAKTTAQNTENQQQSVDMVAAAINQMGATVQEIAKNANDTADAAKQASVDSQEGQQVVNKTVAGINSLFEKMQGASLVIETLADDVGDISTVLEVIRGISEQTNLLALNAAIEAARAGEQGRGFAVVADEVRTLAQRTQESTEEINSMILKLQSGAKDAVQAMSTGIETAANSVENADMTGQTLNKITQAISAISDLSIQVATATEEQSSVVNELNTHILNIKNMSDNNVIQAKTIDDRCNGLSDSSNTLGKMVASFKL